jgi:Ca2+-binding RTX toxin-like protein
VGASVQVFGYFGSGAGRTFAGSTNSETLAIAPSADIENATGSSFNDVIYGNALANVLRGGAGNDVLNGRGGRDIIDGGAGEDTAVFTGSMRDYTVTQAVDHYTVTRASDPSSVAILRSIERVEFSDAALAAQQPASSTVQTEGLMGQAFRLYRAALDRAPDAAGLEYQTKALEGGLSLSQLAGNFMASPEFQQRFGAPKNSEFVTLLYNNVLDRDPEAAGLAYHTGYLDSNTLTRADVLVGFSESPENQAAVVGIGQLGTLVQV